MARENVGYRVGPDGPRRSQGKWLSLLKSGVCLLGLKERGLRNALDIRLTEIELTLARLPPEFDGYRILQISDPHLDELPELVDRAKSLVYGLSADLLVLTGDIRGKTYGPCDQSVRLLEAIVGAVDCSTRLAILGNHDPAQLAEELEGIGFHVLINSTVAVTHRGTRILVTGLDDVHTFYTEEAANALVRAANTFQLVLVHSAEMADHASLAGYDLYLCGHTHGGQICFPGGKEIISTLTRCKLFGRGVWRCGSMSGYTSTGLGVSGVRARFNCPGEIAVITLRSIS